jgi:hypothetical protein
MTDTTLWINPAELKRLLAASKHEPGTIYRSDEAAGLNGLDDAPPVPLYLSPDHTPQTSPRVKPLRWKGPDSSGECHSLDGLWGYIIRPGNGNGYWMTEVGGYYATPEAAQQAANEDYERRILSALAATTEGSKDA